MLGLERTDDFEAERGRVWCHRVRPAHAAGLLKGSEVC